jgi:hypothetical protein
MVISRRIQDAGTRNTLDPLYLLIPPLYTITQHILLNNLVNHLSNHSLAHPSMMFPTIMKPVVLLSALSPALGAEVHPAHLLRLHIQLSHLFQSTIYI